MSWLNEQIRSTHRFLRNWQEFIVWLPLMVALAVAGWIVLGGVARVGSDPIAWLVELPVLCAYAAAAGGCAWLFKNTYLHDINRNVEHDLHRLAQAGDANAKWILIKDRLEWLVLLILAFAFFWPAR